MSLFAVAVGFAPGLALMAWGLSAGFASRVGVPERRPVTPPPGAEVWTSPFADTERQPDPRTIQDFGLARIGFGGVFVLIGILITAHVYPFAGSRARHTTTVALPGDLLGLPAAAELVSRDRTTLKAVSDRSYLDQVDLRAYGQRYPVAATTTSFVAFPLVAIAARGDLPESKVEARPGGFLDDLFGPRFPQPLKVEPGPLAVDALCLDLVEYNQKGFGCEFFGRTFLVVVVDHLAKNAADAGERAQVVVAQTVQVKGTKGAPQPATSPDRA